MMCARGHIYDSAPSPRSRCPVCEKARKAERYRTDPGPRLLSTRRCQQVRNLAADRDDNRCRFEGPDCYGRLEAHHLVAIKFGGAAFDLENIALMCKRHHFLLERETRMRAQGTLRE